MKRRAATFMLAGCAAALLLPSGCEEKQDKGPPAVSDSVERGPFELRVEASPPDALIGDVITLRERVTAPADFVVEFAELAESDSLEVLQTSDPEQAISDAGVVWSRVLTLDPLVSGEIEIPPLVARYARKPETPDVAPKFENELATDSLKLKIRSALTSQDSPSSPRDITLTLAAPPQPRSPWFWAGLAGAILGVLALVALAVWRIERWMHRPAPPVPAEEWARAALAKLAALNWFEREQVREFYYRLSEIVRVYIEKKFTLAAPEMTTEEFLVALTRDRGALPYDAATLQQFLESCDLVKYAAFEPRREDGERSLDAARAFVDATAAAAQHAAQAPPAASEGRAA